MEFLRVFRSVCAIGTAVPLTGCLSEQNGFNRTQNHQLCRTVRQGAALTVYFLFVVTGISYQALASDCAELVKNFSSRAGLPNDDRLRGCFNEAKQLSQKGDALAGVVLGYMRQRGIATRRSARRARKAYERGSQQGLAVADLLLGKFYIGRFGAKKADFLKAEVHLRRAIKGGEPDAVPVLVDLYRSGKIGTKSLEQVQAVFALSKQPATSSELLSRGKLFLRPNSEANNLKKALSYLRQAAELGNAEAKFLTAALLAEMRGKSMTDDSEAYRLLREAAVDGHDEAMFALGKLRLASANPAERTEGLKLLLKAARVRHAEATSALGEIYYEGKIAPRNFHLAKKYWFEAALLGSDTAKLHLNYVYKNLERAEQLIVNGAYSDPESFQTDLGRLLIGNHYLSLVQEGQRGAYIKGEYGYYIRAKRAFSMVSASTVVPKEIAAQAREVGRRLQSGQAQYEKDLKNRRASREAKFWVGVVVAGIAILSLAGRNAPAVPIETKPVDLCAGFDGLGLWQSSYAGPVGLVGCRPYY